MNTLIDMLLVAGITIYIVDLSGFTDAWLAAFSKFLGRRVSSVRPFSCGQCMTWWLCLLYCIIAGKFNLATIGMAALLSFLSVPIGQVMIFTKEWVSWIINKLMPKWE